jgi:hypothetical protein
MVAGTSVDRDLQERRRPRFFVSVLVAGVFETLREPELFARARVNAELGTVLAELADLDSDARYAKVAGVPVPEYAGERRRADLAESRTFQSRST